MRAWDLLLAVGLDALWGDPLRWPHPVRFLGRWIQRLEQGLRRWVVPWLGERGAGGILVVLVVGGTWGLVQGGLWGASWVHPLLGEALGIYLIWAALALRSLGAEALAVARLLEAGDLEEARRQVAGLVSRETQALDAEGVARATVESVAENASDGVIAPLFYLALGGPALAWVYKAVNTLDSMVGYRTPLYRHFGWAAARLDDLANWIPARLTALGMVGWAFGWGRAREAFRIWRRDGHQTESPNAGHPMAAAAGALGVRLGGPACYHGTLKRRPWLGAEGNPPGPETIRQAVQLLWGTAMLMILGTALWLEVHHGM